MKPKQILILSVILGILALGILLKAWVRSVEEGTGPARGSGVAFAEVAPAKIERILIGRGLEAAPVELAKENGIWKVKSLWNATANPAKVEKLIGQLGALRGELRGTGKELLKDFGIEDMDSFSIKCLGTGDAPLLDLRVGTKKDGDWGSFIRKAGSADVYVVDLDPAEILGIYTDLETAKPAGNFWADLSLFRLDPAKVTKIQLYLTKGNEETLVAGLAREIDPKDPGRSSWKYLRQEMLLPLDTDKVVKFLATMNSVPAEKVVDPDGTNYGLEKPVWRLVVTEDGQEKVLISGPKAAEGEHYYVKTSSGPSVFSLAGTYFDDLNVDDTHFVAGIPLAEPPKAAPSQESGIPIPEGPGQAT